MTRNKWGKYGCGRRCILFTDNVVFLENLRINWKCTETHLVAEKSSWLQINVFYIPIIFRKKKFSFAVVNNSALVAWSEKAVAPHSSTLAWKIPWAEEPGRLQSMGSPRVGHDWVTSLSLFTFMHWRRKWQPTPVFLPGESQGRGSLVGCCLWGHTESDTTEATDLAAAAAATAVLFLI